MPELRKPRDLRLLDIVDSLTRESFSIPVWRVVRAGRDPLLGVPSNSRWCDGSFDVIYSSLTRDGAIAEVYALLCMQPVFPTKVEFFAHRIALSSTQMARLDHLDRLAELGIDPSSYGDRNYSQTQAISDAAYFLGFDGLLVPSARVNCLNAVYFSDRLLPGEMQVIEREQRPIDWHAWRKTRPSSKR
jgi:hypothetical protein